MNTLGVTKDMLGKHSEAQAAYRRVLQINPENYSAKNNLALSLALTGNHGKSIKLLEEIASSTKSTPITKQNLALVYAAAGRTEDAMTDGALRRNGRERRSRLPLSRARRPMKTRPSFSAGPSASNSMAPSSSPRASRSPWSPAFRSTSPYTENWLTSVATAPQTQAPTIINVKTNVPGSTPSVTTTTASKGKVADEDWADDWNEELVDAADIAALPDTPPSYDGSDSATNRCPRLRPRHHSATPAVTSTAKAEPLKSETPENLPMASAGPVNDTPQTIPTLRYRLPRTRIALRAPFQRRLPLRRFRRRRQ